MPDHSLFRVPGEGAAGRASSARRKRLSAPAQGRAPKLRQLADKPIRLGRIGEPRLRPAVLNAGLNGARADALPTLVEERQLATGLAQAPHQPSTLGC